MREYGPYHIVNLDLCGSIFPNSTSDVSDYYEALLQLLAYQFEHQRTEWLLFLTTMIEPSVVNIEKLQDLCKPTHEKFCETCRICRTNDQDIPEGMFQKDVDSLDLSVLDDQK